MSFEWPPGKKYRDAETLLVEEIKRRGLVKRVRDAQQEARIAAGEAGKTSFFKKENPLVREVMRLGELAQVVEYLSTKAKPGQDWKAPVVKHLREGEKKDKRGLLSASADLVLGENPLYKRGARKMEDADYERLLKDIEEHAVFRSDLSLGRDNEFLNDYPELLHTFLFTKTKHEKAKEALTDKKKEKKTGPPVRFVGVAGTMKPHAKKAAEAPKQKREEVIDEPQPQVAESVPETIQEDTGRPPADVVPLRKEAEAIPVPLTAEKAREALAAAGKGYLTRGPGFESDEEAEHALLRAEVEYQNAVAREDRTMLSKVGAFLEHFHAEHVRSRKEGYETGPLSIEEAKRALETAGTNYIRMKGVEFEKGTDAEVALQKAQADYLRAIGHEDPDGLQKAEYMVDIFVEQCREGRQAYMSITPAEANRFARKEARLDAKLAREAKRDQKEFDDFVERHGLKNPKKAWRKALRDYLLIAIAQYLTLHGGAEVLSRAMLGQSAGATIEQMYNAARGQAPAPDAEDVNDGPTTYGVGDKREPRPEERAIISPSSFEPPDAPRIIRENEG